MPSIAPPRMVTVGSADLEFRTKSDNYRAYIKGPGYPKDGKRIKHKEHLTINDPGIYTVVARDKQLRTIEASIEDKLTPPVSKPAKIAHPAAEMVVLEIEVK
jgi:hypothetical protein